MSDTSAPRLDLDVLNYAISAHINRLRELGAASDDPLILTLRAATETIAAEARRADEASVQRDIALAEILEILEQLENHCTSIEPESGLSCKLVPRHNSSHMYIGPEGTAIWGFAYDTASAEGLDNRHGF